VKLSPDECAAMIRRTAARLDQRLDAAGEWSRIHDTRLEALEADVAAIVAGMARLERRVAETEEAISVLAALRMGALEP
jgi:hypothetical protein